MSESNFYNFNRNTINNALIQLGGKAIHRKSALLRRPGEKYSEHYVITGVSDDPESFKRIVAVAMAGNKVSKFLSSSSSVMGVIKQVLGGSIFQPKAPAYSGLNVYDAIGDTELGAGLSAAERTVIASILIDLLDPLGMRVDIRSFGTVIENKHPDVITTQVLINELLTNSLYDALRVTLTNGVKLCPVSDKRMPIASLEEYIIKVCMDLSQAFEGVKYKSAKLRSVLQIVSDVEFGRIDKNLISYGDLREHSSIRTLRECFSISYCACVSDEQDSVASIPAHELQGECDFIIRQMGLLPNYELVQDASSIIAMSAYRNRGSRGINSVTLCRRAVGDGQSYFYRVAHDVLKKNNFADVRNDSKMFGSYSIKCPKSLNTVALSLSAAIFDYSNSNKNGLCVHLLNMDTAMLQVIAAIGTSCEFIDFEGNEVPMVLEDDRARGFEHLNSFLTKDHKPFVVGYQIFDLESKIAHLLSGLDTYGTISPILAVMSKLPENDDFSSTSRWSSEQVVRNKFFGGVDMSGMKRANSIILSLPAIDDVIGACSVPLYGGEDIIPNSLYVNHGEGFNDLVEVLNSVANKVNKSGQQLSNGVRSMTRQRIVACLAEWLTNDSALMRLVIRAAYEYSKTVEDGKVAFDFNHAFYLGICAREVILAVLSEHSTVLLDNALVDLIRHDDTTVTLGMAVTK